jgi:hypothetical protein
MGIQDGKTTRKLQTIAIARARFLCFVLDKLTSRFMHVFLDVFGQDPELPIADQ